MKRSAKSLTGFTMGATDGDIGKVKEFYFDDETWTVRYLVVETGNWLSGRKVLISPQALKTPNWDDEVFPVELTKDQVKHSPEIDTDKPVSRQHENLLYEHYAWNNYWGGGLWGGGIGTAGMIMPTPVPLEEELEKNKDAYAGKDEAPKKTETPEGDPHLRSTDNIKGYAIKATDGDIGDVEDFIIDDESWKIDFIVVDTGNWFPGKKVLLSPDLIKDIDWQTETVSVKTNTDTVKHSPEYDADEPIDEAYAKQLGQHYGNGVTY